MAPIQRPPSAFVNVYGHWSSVGTGEPVHLDVLGPAQAPEHVVGHRRRWPLPGTCFDLAQVGREVDEDTQWTFAGERLFLVAGVTHRGAELANRHSPTLVTGADSTDWVSAAVFVSTF
jgi:hypothetical protein